MVAKWLAATALAAGYSINVDTLKYSLNKSAHDRLPDLIFSLVNDALYVQFIGKIGRVGSIHYFLYCPEYNSYCFIIFFFILLRLVFCI